MYDFDTFIPRKNTACVKYDGASVFKKPEGLLPLWVADMDFPAPDAVRDRLRQCADHGIFGYPLAPESYYKAVLDWFSEHFAFQAERRWIVPAPGVVFALASALRAFTEPGDSILINRPVYYPFSNVILQNHRSLISSSLVLKEGKYEIDFADMEQKIIDHKIKLYILCSPHNPVGRVWTEGELKQIASLCRKHGVRVVSDEIHCDFVWSEHPHRNFAALNPDMAEYSMICTAPSKTFNLAGLQTSNIFLPGQEMRRRFRRELQAQGAEGQNYPGMLACEAAYRHGLPWLQELRSYLGGNIAFIRNAVQRELPGVHLIEPEGTYLLWLDFREFKLPEDALEQLITDAGLWLDEGTMFGPEGLGFQRMNIACPRSLLEEAIRRLKARLLP